MFVKRWDPQRHVWGYSEKGHKHKKRKKKKRDPSTNVTWMPALPWTGILGERASAPSSADSLPLSPVTSLHRDTFGPVSSDVGPVSSDFGPVSSDVDLPIGP